MTLAVFTKRNIKLFFKDKGMFFTSLVTPAILLVLYATFLGNVYRDNFVASMPDGIEVSSDVIDGIVAGQLMSSILAVSCVTVAFCTNLLMVQDKARGAVRDLAVTPANPAVLSAGYVCASLVSTLIICFVSTGICLGYVRFMGWFMAPRDVLMLFAAVFILAFFGISLSSVVNFFLSTEGQISAVSSIISAGYGFICGGYMPISAFGEGLRKAVSFLPGTYGTSLVREYSLNGVLTEMEGQGVPAEVTDYIRDFLDCAIYFNDKEVPEPAKYAVVLISALALMGIYIALNVIKNRKSA